MKLFKQFTIIIFLSFLGEVLHTLIPFPIPASIYGIIILSFLLERKVLRIDDIREVSDVCACEHAPAYSEETFGIPDCVPGNVLEVTDKELCVIRGFLDEIRNVSVHVPPVKIRRGSVVSGKDLPKAICVYSDGSEHEKAVDWDGEAIQKLDTAVPGTFRIPGKVRRSPWHFPMRLEYGGMDPRDLNDANLYRGMSDPCITYYTGTEKNSIIPCPADMVRQPYRG